MSREALRALLWVAVLWAVVAVVVILLAACGSKEPKPTPAPPKASICAHKDPAQAGECLKQEQRAKGYRPTMRVPATSTSAPQGVDISNWQGVPSLGTARANGIRFVIIQTNAGAFRNPFYWLQAADARNAGLPFGTYTFIEPSMGGSTQANISAAVRKGSGASLGMWADAEVGGAYEQACPYTSTAPSNIVGVYSSNGNWPGYRCKGYDWPANWGGGSATPLPGYTSSATKVRQWCGTCRFPGFSGEVDRDESLGLLSLVNPPGPTHAEVVARWHRELNAHYRLRAALHVLIERHKCRPGQHATPASYHTVCVYWLVRGQVQVRIILAFHRKGIY